MPWGLCSLVFTRGEFGVEGESFRHPVVEQVPVAVEREAGRVVPEQPRQAHDVVIAVEPERHE